MSLPAHAVALRLVQGDSSITSLTGGGNDPLALGDFDGSHTFKNVGDKPMRPVLCQTSFGG